MEVEKRGRKPMTEEEKQLAKEKRELKKSAIEKGELTDDVTLFDIIKNLSKEIKKNVSKLKSIEIDKLKNSLTILLDSIDTTLEEVKLKEINLEKTRITIELSELLSKQKELEEKLKNIK